MIRVTINAAKLRAQIEAEFLIAKQKRLEHAEPVKLTGWSKSAPLAKLSEDDAKEILEQSLNSALYKWQK